MDQVVAALDATLSPDKAARGAAEASLAQQCLLPQWPTVLLTVIGEARLPAPTRLAAALALKRATREHWHYDAPTAGAPSSPYPEEVKAAVRKSFIAFTVAQHGSAPLINALSASFLAMAKHDYPGHWGTVDGELREGLASGDVPRTMVTLRLFLALAKYYAYRRFNEAMDGLSPCAVLFERLMGVLLPLARYLHGAPDSEASSLGLALCLKLYFRGMEFRFPEYPAVCDKDVCGAWCALCLEVLRKVPPPPGSAGAFVSPLDPQDRAEWAPWRAKKWAARVLGRMAEKWTPSALEDGAEPPPALPPGASESDQREYAARLSERAARARALPAARAFKAATAPAAAEVVLGQLFAWSSVNAAVVRPGSSSGSGGGGGSVTTAAVGGDGAEWLSPTVRVLYMSLLGDICDFSSVWKPLQPHLPQLVQTFLPAALRPSPEDLEALEEDPETWLVEMNNPYMASACPANAAERLLLELLARRKAKVLPLLVGLLQGVLVAYAGAPPERRDPLLKEAALRMLAIASREVRMSKAYVGSLEALLVNFVSPDFAPGTPTVLRVRALLTWSQFVGCKAVGKAPKVAACEALVNCMLDPASMAVRQVAANALAPFLMHSKACRSALQPHIATIIGALFKLLHEVGLDDVVSTMQVVVEEYHAQLLQIGGSVAAAMQSLCVRLIQKAAQAAAAGGGEDDALEEETAMATAGCCEVMLMLIGKLQTPPPGAAPPGAVLWAEGTAVLKRDVLPSVWGLLEYLLPLPPPGAAADAAAGTPEFAEEALRMAFSAFDALELDMTGVAPVWGMFTRIQRFVALHPTEWVDGWAPCVDLCLAAAGPWGVFHGASHPATGGVDVGAELVRTIEEIEKSCAEEECEVAARITMSLLHYCRGGVDRLLGHVLTLHAHELMVSKTESYVRMCSSVLAVALQYNAAATVACLGGLAGEAVGLQPGEAPAGAGAAVFSKWMDVMQGLVADWPRRDKPTDEDPVTAKVLKQRLQHCQMSALGLCCLLSAAAEGRLPAGALPLPSIVALTAALVMKEQECRQIVAQRLQLASALAVERAKGDEEEEEEGEGEEEEGAEDEGDGVEDGGDEEAGAAAGGRGDDEGSVVDGEDDDEYEDDEEDDEMEALSGPLTPLDHCNTPLFFNATMAALAQSPVWTTIAPALAAGTQQIIQASAARGAELAAQGVSMGYLGPLEEPLHPMAAQRVVPKA